MRIAGFSGMVPRTDPRYLNDNQAQIAVNCVMTDGTLRPLNAMRYAGQTATPGPLRAIHRVETENGVSHWLSWNKPVKVVRGPLAGDERIYYTGDGEPRYSTVEAATSSGLNNYPSTFWALGVPAPRARPIIGSINGGEGDNETRAYVTTFKTALGEESEPSLPSEPTVGKADATWVLGFEDIGPANTGAVVSLIADASTRTVTLTVTTAADRFPVFRKGAEIRITGATGATELNGVHKIVEVVESHKIKIALHMTGTYDDGSASFAMVAPWNIEGMKRCIYRVVTGNQSNDYLLVAEIDATQTTFEDGVPGSSLSRSLQTRDWAPPPGDLQSICVLPNGSLAGISGNLLCISEPGYPHAWPYAYQHILDYPGVAIAPFDRSIAVATTSHPAIASGVDPAMMSIDTIKEVRACLTPESAASFSFGMVYATTQGLGLLGQGGFSMASRDLVTEKEWAAYRPHTIQATAHEGRYYAIHRPFVDGPSRMFVVDRWEAASLYEISVSPDAIYADPNGSLYLAFGNSIWEFDADESQRMLHFWRSKDFYSPRALTVTAAQIDADWTMTPQQAAQVREAYEAQVADNEVFLADTDIVRGEMNWGPLNSMVVNGSKIPDVPVISFDSLSFTFYVDGEPVWSGDVTDSRPFSLPDGYKAHSFSFAVGGNVRVRSVGIGETFLSLREGQ